MLRVLICEDVEENAVYLENILQDIEGVEVVGWAKDGMSSVNMVKSLSPDVVFMDIGLPDMDGLSVTEVIKQIHPDIFVVVITAFDTYALDAYRLYVYDYIIKPYNKVRVIKTLDNIVKLKYRKEKGIHIPARNAREKIVIKTRDEIIFLDQQEIVMIEKEEHKCCIYTANNMQVLETYDTLNALEERLDRNMFFRSHRGYLINIFYVDRIVNYGKKVYTVKLKGIKKEAIISYLKINDIEALIRQSSIS